MAKRNPAKAGSPDEAERVHAEDRAAWRAWLERNHDSAPGVWLVSWKAHTGRPRMSYEESVVEALRVGWIDSKGQKLDDERSMLWFTPRKPKSGWSRPNKERIARLEADDDLHPAGRAVIERAREDGSWSLLDDVEDLVVPDDLAAAFAAHRGSRANWDAFPPSARRAILGWIVQAKRPETRQKRIDETASLAAENIRANQSPRSG